MDNRLSVRAGSTLGGGKNKPAAQVEYVRSLVLKQVEGLAGGVILRCTALLTRTTGFVVGPTRCLPRGEG